MMAIYESLFTRRLLYNLLFLLLIFTYITSNVDGFFRSEVFRLEAEGTVDHFFWSKAKRSKVVTNLTSANTL